jgi:hypothetical protein
VVDDSPVADEVVTAVVDPSTPSVPDDELLADDSEFTDVSLATDPLVASPASGDAPHPPSKKATSVAITRCAE